MPTLIGTMLVVLVKPTVLAFVSYFYWGANLLRSLQGRIVPYLHKDLLIWHYKMCKVGELWLPVQKLLLFPYGCLTLLVSFFLSWLLLVPSSLFLFPFISFASTASSAFIYFWAFRCNSATVFGGLLVIEKKKSPGSNPAWKVVKMTWSSISSTYSSSLLNQVMYCLSDFPFTCWVLKRWAIGFLCLYPPMKWQQNPCLVVQNLQ